MVFLIWLVVILVVVAFLLLIPTFWRRAIYERYSGARPVACPENQQPAVVSLDVHHAVATVMDGSPRLRLSDCTRWPERAKCNQKCLSQAIRAESYKPGEVTPGRKQIYHLPVLLAAFAAWYVGAVWHSQYLFRERWMHAAGITHAQVKEAVWWITPQLLAAAACLLFAYGVAWLLAVSHRKGVLPGVLMSALLGGAVIAVSSYAIARVPHDLLVIEAGYMALATILIGTIVGGLYDKLVLRPET